MLSHPSECAMHYFRPIVSSVLGYWPKEEATCIHSTQPHQTEKKEKRDVDGAASDVVVYMSKFIS